MLPRGQCACKCHEPAENIRHVVACCYVPDAPESPKWKRPAAGFGPKRIHDGKAECNVCGKWKFEVLHSCSGVPVTDAAKQRWAEAYDADAHED